MIQSPRNYSPEIKKVSDIMVHASIDIENTRVHRGASVDPELAKSFDILQASIEKDPERRNIGHLSPGIGAPVRVVRGDHSSDLE